MNAMRVVATVATIALGLGACATTQTQWVQTNQGDPLASAITQCRYEAAAMAGPPGVVSGTGLNPVLLGLTVNKARQRDLFRACMEARGFTRQ